ncbi:flagellar brake protein [Massilia forsythiae]|uniref:Flagellar brake protein n=1 Tax=Massilia forsythiae TaxID=2728020 RepID=A0A7Z2VXW8_9BURK|nr:PilZ domain-containing protein [Massilia forsythiae]QJE01456.1 flagellar brake protein [Massilia forsythiae]
MTDFAPNHLRKGPPKAADAVDRIGPQHGAHQMRDASEIAGTLAGLAQAGEAVTVYPPGRLVAMARIDEVLPDDACFTLDLADGDLVLAEGKTTLVASLGGNAKIQFELDADWNVVPGRPHLTRLPIPVMCQVLNRRAEPRLETPVGVNYSARFTTLGKVFELPLHDFSSGGVGMRATPEQAYELYVGRKLDGVQLDLGPSLRIVADLEVRLLRPFRTFLLGQQVQIGCRISQIAMQMRQGLDRAVTTVQKRR